MRHPEAQYLDPLEQILEHGDRRVDRTGVGTLSIFGALTCFNLADGDRADPHHETRLMEDLGQGDALVSDRQHEYSAAAQNNVRIWTDWPLDCYRKEMGTVISQSEFEQKIIDDDAFPARWGELGQSTASNGAMAWPDGKEHDQIAALIKTIKINPSSRRMLFHA